MSDTLKFEDLTPEQVDDLLAAEVMGWVDSPLNPDVWDTTPERANYVSHVWKRPTLGKPYFDPFHSLDDCRRAFVKLLSLDNEYKINYALGERYIESVCQVMEWSYDDIDFHLGWQVEQMSASQKCHAILKTKGLVQ